MHAKRFRLDHEGNLHADRLFCQVLLTDPALLDEAGTWMTHKRLDNRAAKADALLRFETAWRSGDKNQALALAREIHVLMLAQRSVNDLRKGRVSTFATIAAHTGIYSQTSVIRKPC